MASKRFEKQLDKLDPQVARRILQDMDCLKEAPCRAKYLKTREREN
jgi:mRNA-degrading endonuclease RelE of RelBE toxin-antitoxin system